MDQKYAHVGQALLLYFNFQHVCFSNLQYAMQFAPLLLGFAGFFGVFFLVGRGGLGGVVGVFFVVVVFIFIKVRKGKAQFFMAK